MGLVLCDEWRVQVGPPRHTAPPSHATAYVRVRRTGESHCPTDGEGTSAYRGTLPRLRYKHTVALRLRWSSYRFPAGRGQRPSVAFFQHAVPRGFCMMLVWLIYRQSMAADESSRFALGVLPWRSRFGLPLFSSFGHCPGSAFLKTMTGAFLVPRAR